MGTNLVLARHCWDSMPREVSKVKNLPLNLSSALVEGKDKEPRVFEAQFLSPAEKSPFTTEK
jgi:hypothetical protein